MFPFDIPNARRYILTGANTRNKLTDTDTKVTVSCKGLFYRHQGCLYLTGNHIIYLQITLGCIARNALIPNGIRGFESHHLRQKMLVNTVRLRAFSFLEKSSRKFLSFHSKGRGYLCKKEARFYSPNMEMSENKQVQI